MRRPGTGAGFEDERTGQLLQVQLVHVQSLPHLHSGPPEQPQVTGSTGLTMGLPQHSAMVSDGYGFGFMTALYSCRRCLGENRFL